jgi:hypothetical protein
VRLLLHIENGVDELAKSCANFKGRIGDQPDMRGDCPAQGRLFVMTLPVLRSPMRADGTIARKTIPRPRFVVVAYFARPTRTR